MSPVQSFPLSDQIISTFSEELSNDFSAYRNHVYRELNFFLALSGLSAIPISVLVAAAFHDLGIWTHQTFDYLSPSIELASTYLVKEGLAELQPEVCSIIREHHKILPYAGIHSTNVETFRKADLIDLSFGTFQFGLPRRFVRSVRASFPNAGFHRRLGALTMRQLVRTPWHPLPMFHW